MMQIKNLFLIGPMGAGKTTVGRQLSELLRMDFIDTDHEIQQRTGVDIPTIFEFEGEEGFRNREQNVINELTQREGVIVATGGGAVLREVNRQHLSSRGYVIYLHCTPEQQYERTYRDRNRPLLQTDDPLAKLSALLELREPLYRQIADLVIVTEGRNTQSVVREIVKKIESSD
ncbi:MAG: shikimate kinase AroK [Candidatus Thiodiazotropha sp. (ex Monitilora ramsayi)]|nr:shikimate kinase AroK [Candidatus Thiodiazotropha sp. (ex Monitilora ramsayi)]